MAAVSAAAVATAVTAAARRWSASGRRPPGRFVSALVAGVHAYVA